VLTAVRALSRAMDGAVAQADRNPAAIALMARTVVLRSMGCMVAVSFKTLEGVVCIGSICNRCM